MYFLKSCFLLLLIPFSVVFSMPSSTPDSRSLDVRFPTDVATLNNDGNEGALLARANTGSMMIYYGLAPLAISGAYFVYRGELKIGLPIIAAIVAFAFVQAIPGVAIHLMNVKMAFAEMKDKLEDLEHQSKMRGKQQLEMDMRLKTMVQDYRHGYESHQMKVAEHLQKLREWERTEAQASWAESFKPRLDEMEKVVEECQAGQSSLAEAKAQADIAADTTKSDEERADARKAATKALQQARADVGNAAKEFGKLKTMLASDEDWSPTSQAVQDEMKKLTFLDSGSSNGSPSRRSNLPHLIGQATWTCDDDDCPLLWYSVSHSFGKRGEFNTHDITHDFFITPPGYDFNDPASLTRRDPGFDDEYEVDCDELNLYGRLSLREGPDDASASVIALMSMDELQSRILDAVNSAPKVTEDGMTFNEMERPGVHCINLDTDGGPPAIRAVYSITDNADDLHEDLGPRFSQCASKIG